MSHTQIFNVENMKCAGCVATVESALRKVDGVEQASADLSSGTATVVGEVDPEAVIAELTGEGYPATLRAA